MRRAGIVLGLCAAFSAEGAAQITVFDPAVTARNTATAAVKEFLLTTEREQHSQLRRMAQRLSAFTNLAKYHSCKTRRVGGHMAPTFCSRRHITTHSRLGTQRGPPSSL